MGAYFLDASAVVKLYIRETGSLWVRALAGPVSVNDLFVVHLTSVEVAAALYRRVHAGLLAADEADRRVSDMQQDLHGFEVIEVTSSLIELALTIAESRWLRGYDCVQLAGALVAARAPFVAGLEPMAVVTADQELKAAAEAEGMSVDDPNEH